MFDRLKSSLEEGEKFAAGELTLKTFTVPSPPPTYTPERINRIRKSLHMSQGVFAHVLNVSTKTVQSWEQGLREPTQAARFHFRDPPDFNEGDHRFGRSEATKRF